MIDPVKLLEEYQEQEESVQKKAALHSSRRSLNIA